MSENKKYDYTSVESVDRNGPRGWLPLYGKLCSRGNAPFELNSYAHTGLLFDKFSNHWSGKPDWKEKQDTRNKKHIPEAGSDTTWNANPKTWFLNRVIKHSNEHKAVPCLLKEYHKRQDAFVRDKLGGEVKPLKTSWRFVSGLGMGHVLETGFIWHRTLGVPYLPGSSVKGMVRAWAKEWSDKWDDKIKDEEVVALFGGTVDKSEKVNKKSTAGRVIIFDALPKERPKIELDIMNPHYLPYYEDNKKPPADYYSPVPIFFLAVASGVEFNFYLAPRPGVGSDDDLKNASELLCKALENIGAGAKTAVGYGQFSSKEGGHQEIASLASQELCWENVVLTRESGTGDIKAVEKGKNEGAFARGDKANAILKKLDENQRSSLTGKRPDGTKKKRKPIAVKKISVESIGSMLEIKDIVEQK